MPDRIYSLSTALLHFLFGRQIAAVKHQDWFDVVAQQHVHKLHAVPYIPANRKTRYQSQWGEMFLCGWWNVGGKFSLVCCFSFGQLLRTGKSSFMQPAVGVHGHCQTLVLHDADGLRSILDELKESRDPHPDHNLKSRTVGNTSRRVFVSLSQLVWFDLHLVCLTTSEPPKTNLTTPRLWRTTGIYLGLCRTTPELSRTNLKAPKTTPRPWRTP